MATKSWLTVPESIRVVFDRFPLQVNSAAQIPESLVSTWNETNQEKEGSRSQRKITLHVYNLDAQDKLATDPEALEIQGLLKLKSLDHHLQMKVVSVHSAPDTAGKLPYLIDTPAARKGSNKKGTSQNKRTLYSSVQSIRNNLLAPVQGLPAVHRALITSTLRDAWLVTVLLNDELRQVVFGEGPYRIQKVPNVIEQYLQDGWTLQVIEELRPRYPAIIDSVVGNNNITRLGGGLYQLLKSQWNSSRSSSNIVQFFRESKQGQEIIEEIQTRARECLNVFNTKLSQDNGGYLGIGHDDNETNEDVLESGLGPLDVLLFSYVYTMQMRQPQDAEFAAMLEDYPLVVEHAQRVYAELFA